MRLGYGDIVYYASTDRVHKASVCHGIVNIRGFISEYKIFHNDGGRAEQPTVKKNRLFETHDEADRVVRKEIFQRNLKGEQE